MTQPRIARAINLDGSNRSHAFQLAHCCWRLPPLAESNASGTPVDYRSFYTPDLVELVGSIYAEDVTRFGYRFESSPFSGAGG
jgi:hypothetical protein